MLDEPANESNGMPDTLKTSIYRGNFSYTHDFKWYAEESGMETVKCEMIRPYYPYEDFPIHRNTAHYKNYRSEIINLLNRPIEVKVLSSVDTK